MMHPSAGRGPGWDRRQGSGRPSHHDPYKPRAKASGSAVCSTCGALLHMGRWTWKQPEGELPRTLCPACERIRDRYPAGTLRVHGAPAALRREVEQRVRNVEAAEKAEHPLERLMDVQTEGDTLVVTTTGMHLARRLAAALERSFHGHAQVRYPPDEAVVQVDWMQ